MGTFLNKKAISQKAKTVRVRAKQNANGQLNIYDMILSYGYKIQESEFSDKDVQGMILFGNEKIKIFITADQTKEEKLFTLTHLFSHICLDHCMIKNGLFMDFNKPLIDYIYPEEVFKELQANFLTAEILIPRESFLRNLKKYGSDIQLLSNHYGLPDRAIVNRMESLGLFN